MASRKCVQASSSQARIRSGSSCERLLQQPPRLDHPRRVVADVGCLGEEVVVVGAKALRPLAAGGLRSRLRERAAVARQRPDDPAHHLVVHREQVVRRPIVALGPEVRAGGGIDQLRRYPHALGAGLEAALEHVAHAELPADLAHVDRLALVGEAGIAGDHEQVARSGELGDQILGEGVGQTLLALVAAKIVERQHGDGGPVGQSRSGCPWQAAPLVPPPAADASHHDEQEQEDGRPGRRARPAPPGGARGDLAGRHAPDLDRLGDVLDPVPAHGLEAEGELVLDLVVHVAGDADPARLGQGLEPRGDVDPVAEDIAGLVDDVADVDADAEADAFGLGDGRLPLGHAALDRDRAGDRVDGAGKLAEDAVAHQLDDTPAMLGDERLDELLTVGFQAVEGALLVALHQARVADHVRREDGGEPAVDPRRRHGRPPCGR